VRVAPLLLLCLLCADGAAQDPRGGTGVAENRADSATPPAPTQLDPVRVVGKRPDPFAFRNPVEAGPTTFSRDWDESPSLEEIGMRGGIVQIAINTGLELTAKGIRSLPFWQNQVVSAEARPPPLDEAQLARAARLHETGGPARPDPGEPR
jgi:hypothetical protein